MKLGGNKKYISDKENFPTYRLPQDYDDTAVEMMDFTEVDPEAEMLKIQRQLEDVQAIKVTKGDLR